MNQQKTEGLRRMLARAGSIAALGSISIAIGTGGAAAQEPVRGGTLNIIINPEPPILMLGVNQQAPTQAVAGKIYESLLKYSQELEPQPSLAREWEV